MKNKFTLVEMLFIFTASTAMGIAFWAYTFPYKLLSPILKAIGINGIFAGFYHIAGPLIIYIVRKPGSAFLGELIAASVSGCISQWGLISLFSGLLQGLGAEMIFTLTRYKYYNYSTLILSSIFSVILGYIVVYFFYYKDLSITYNILRFSIETISSIFLSGVMSKKIADKLLKTGVLNQMNITKSKDPKTQFKKN